MIVIGNTGVTVCVICFTSLYAKFAETGIKSYARGAVFFDFLFILLYVLATPTMFL